MHFIQLRLCEEEAAIYCYCVNYQAETDPLEIRWTGTKRTHRQGSILFYLSFLHYFISFYCRRPHMCNKVAYVGVAYPPFNLRGLM